MLVNDGRAAERKRAGHLADIGRTGRGLGAVARNSAGGIAALFGTKIAAGFLPGS